MQKCLLCLTFVAYIWVGRSVTQIWEDLNVWGILVKAKNEDDYKSLKLSGLSFLFCKIKRLERESETSTSYSTLKENCLNSYIERLIIFVETEAELWHFFTQRFFFLIVQLLHKAIEN